MGWLIVLAVVIACGYWLDNVSRRNKNAELAAGYGKRADENWHWLKVYFEESIKQTKAELTAKHVEFAKYRKQYGRPSYEEKDLTDRLERDQKAYKELSDLNADVERFECRIRDRKVVKSEDLELLTKHLMVVFGRAANSYGARGLEGVRGPDGQRYARFEMERVESE